jgi:hypothetical protein
MIYTRFSHSIIRKRQNGIQNLPQSVQNTTNNTPLRVIIFSAFQKIPEIQTSHINVKTTPCSYSGEMFNFFENSKNIIDFNVTLILRILQI